MTTSSANPTVEAIRLSVQQSCTDLVELIDGPLAELQSEKLYKEPIAGEWSIMQNLAHIIEFMPYWGHEIEKLVAHPGQNFGRTAQDEGRLRAIEEHGRDSLGQIKEELPRSYAQLDEVLGKLKDSDLQLTGQHIRYGKKSLAWFIEDFVTQHLLNHIEQIRLCIKGVA
jgi:DinB superfamily